MLTTRAPVEPGARSWESKGRSGGSVAALLATEPLPAPALLRRAGVTG